MNASHTTKSVHLSTKNDAWSNAVNNKQIVEVFQDETLFKRLQIKYKIVNILKILNITCLDLAIIHGKVINEEECKIFYLQSIL